MAVKDWSTTAGSNTSILSGITLDGSVMTPGQVDNAFREMAAQIASQLGKMGYKGADIASATTTDLSTATGWYVHITGTTTITGLGTVDAGQMFILEFDGALTLTHNASTLILPGAADIKTSAGAIAIAISEGSGSWRLLYLPPRVMPSVQTFTANGTWTKPDGCRFVIIDGCGGGGGSGGVDGQGSGTSGASGGGGSGFSGTTIPISVAGITSAAVTIGAAGTAGASTPTAGGNGGNTSITLNATTYTWGGGSGSASYTAVGSYHASSSPGAGGTGTNINGFSSSGSVGLIAAHDSQARGGNGANSSFGRGGTGDFNFTSGTQGNGLAGGGFGSGGGGSTTVDVVGNSSGAAGAGGFMRIWEYY